MAGCHRPGCPQDRRRTGQDREAASSFTATTTCRSATTSQGGALSYIARHRAGRGRPPGHGGPRGCQDADLEDLGDHETGHEPQDFADHETENEIKEAGNRTDQTRAHTDERDVATDEAAMMDKGGPRDRSRSPHRRSRSRRGTSSSVPPWRRTDSAGVGSGTYARECERQSRCLSEANDEDSGGDRLAWRTATAPWRRGREVTTSEPGSSAALRSHDVSTSTMSAGHAGGSTPPWRRASERPSRSEPVTPTARPRVPSFQPSAGTPEKTRPSVCVQVAEEPAEEEHAEEDEEVDERTVAQDLLARMRRAETGEGHVHGEAREEELPLADDPMVADDEAEHGLLSEYVEVEIPADDELDGATDELGLVQRGRPSVVTKCQEGPPLDTEPDKDHALDTQSQRKPTAADTPDIATDIPDAQPATTDHTELEDDAAEFQEAAIEWVRKCPPKGGDEGRWGRHNDGQPKDVASLRRQADHARGQYEQEVRAAQQEWETHQRQCQEDEELLEVVRAWEQEYALLQMQKRENEEVVDLMQRMASTPLDTELVRPQECLEALPLVAQATSAKMLSHQVREKYGSRKLPEPAAAWQSLSTRKGCRRTSSAQWTMTLSGPETAGSVLIDTFPTRRKRRTVSL